MKYTQNAKLSGVDLDRFFSDRFVVTQFVLAINADCNRGSLLPKQRKALGEEPGEGEKEQQNRSTQQFNFISGLAAPTVTPAQWNNSTSSCAFFLTSDGKQLWEIGKFKQILPQAI